MGDESHSTQVALVIFKKKVKLMTKSEMKSKNLWDLGIMAAGPFLAGVLDGIFFARTAHEVWYHHDWTHKKKNYFVLTALLGDNVFYQWDKMLPCATKSGHY